MLQEEYILNAQDGDKDEKDWKLPVGYVADSHTVDEFSRRVLTRDPMDQGSRGRCVGASGYILYNDTPDNQNVRLSPMWIYKKGQKYDPWPGEDYEGTSISGACKALLKEGCCREALFPYTESTGTQPHTGAIEDASKRKIHSYFKVQLDRINEIKQLLLEECLWVSFDVHAKIYSIGQDGILETAGYLESKKVGGHAVTMIGWKMINGKLYWEFQNSWGIYWGDQGYFFMEHSLLMKIIHGGGVYYLVTMAEEAKRLNDLKADPINKYEPKEKNIISRIMRFIVELITFWKK